MGQATAVGPTWIEGSFSILLFDAGDVDDTPPFTFPRHVHSRDEMLSPNVVMSRPAYHSSSARSLTAFQHSTSKGQLLLLYFIYQVWMLSHWRKFV